MVVAESCVPGRPPLQDRPLLGVDDAARLEAVFKTMANDTRLRLLHALERAGELCVSDLGAAIGLRPQAVSNQLQRLVDRGIVASRRDGNRIWYRICDPCVIPLLDLAWCLTETAENTQTASAAGTVA